MALRCSLLFLYSNHNCLVFKPPYNNLRNCNKTHKRSPFKPRKDKKTYIFVAFRFFLFKFAPYINVYEHENHVMAKPLAW